MHDMEATLESNPETGVLKEDSLGVLTHDSAHTSFGTCNIYHPNPC